MTDTTKGVLLTSDVIKSIVTEAGFRCVDRSKGETIDCVNEFHVVQALTYDEKCKILLEHYDDDICEIIHHFDLDFLNDVLRESLSEKPEDVEGRAGRCVLQLRANILNDADDLLETIIEPYVAHNHKHGWG